MDIRGAGARGHRHGSHARCRSPHRGRAREAGRAVRDRCSRRLGLPVRVRRTGAVAGWTSGDLPRSARRSRELGRCHDAVGSTARIAHRSTAPRNRRGVPPGVVTRQPVCGLHGPGRGASAQSRRRDGPTGVCDPETRRKRTGLGRSGHGSPGDGGRRRTNLLGARNRGRCEAPHVVRHDARRDRSSHAAVPAGRPSLPCRGK
jgi:hypothetical protein